MIHSHLVFVIVSQRTDIVEIFFFPLPHSCRFFLLLSCGHDLQSVPRCNK